MGSYSFTRSAHEDLVDIWMYTQETWGEAQADRYQDDLHRCCERIADGSVHTTFLQAMDPFKSYHCRHHYIFFIVQRETIIIIIIIIAILHERMDLIQRLRDRL